MSLTEKVLSTKTIGCAAAVAAEKRELTKEEMGIILEGYRELFLPFLKDWSLSAIEYEINGLIVFDNPVRGQIVSIDTKIFLCNGVTLYEPGIYNCPFGPNDQGIQHMWGLTKKGEWLRVVIEYQQDLYRIKKITVNKVSAEQLLQGFSLWQITYELNRRVAELTQKRERFYMDAFSLQLTTKLISQTLADLPSGKE